MIDSHIFRNQPAHYGTVNTHVKIQIAKAIYTILVDYVEVEHLLTSETILKLERVTLDWRFSNQDDFNKELKPLYEKWLVQLKGYYDVEQKRLETERLTH